MSPSHVLGDHAPHAAKRLPPALGCTATGPGRRADVVLRDPPLRPRSRHLLDVDARLRRDLADDRRRPRPRARRPLRLRGRLGSSGRRRRGRHGSAVAADHDEHGADRHHLAFRNEDAGDDAGGGRRDLDGRLVRLHLDERVVLGDLRTLGDEPAGDLALRQALPEIRQLELVRHRQLIVVNRIAS